MGISGSPKREGNAEHLLDQALRIATERGYRVERLLCSELEVGFCTDCGNCGQGRPCPIEDDMARVRETLAAASGIIVASPVRFGNVTGQLKVLFDRTLLLRRQGFVLEKQGGMRHRRRTVEEGGARRRRSIRSRPGCTSTGWWSSATTIT